MAEASNKLLEGVFAVQKPPSLSSAQILRELQDKFAASAVFAPLLKETKRKEEEQLRHQRKRRRRRGDDHAFRMGHGGTLDPLATGVLIVGIGKGTKYLYDFLGCTKTYETVVLFGKSTDTYDIAGKIVADASTQHVTRAMVEEQLDSFRGEIKQVPPLYSALKIQGMKAYEYARTGKPLPRDLETRDMKVEECNLLDWYDAGDHDYRWPAEEASGADKAAALKLMHGAEAKPVNSSSHRVGNLQESHRKTGNESPTQQQLTNETTVQPDSLVLKDEQTAGDVAGIARANKTALHTHILPTLSSVPASAPAARIRITVSSGFYVRSFAHDLGLACNSYGLMSELTRTRQGDFTVTDPAPEGLTPVISYEDLGKGEEVWGPKISRILGQWMLAHPDASPGLKAGDRNRFDSPHNSSQKAFRSNGRTMSGKRKRTERTGDCSDSDERRNTSSSG